jgi:hypothetical protein
VSYLVTIKRPGHADAQAFPVRNLDPIRRCGLATVPPATMSSASCGEKKRLSRPRRSSGATCPLDALLVLLIPLGQLPQVRGLAIAQPPDKSICLRVAARVTPSRQFQLPVDHWPTHGVGLYLTKSVSEAGLGDCHWLPGVVFGVAVLSDLTFVKSRSTSFLGERISRFVLTHCPVLGVVCRSPEATRHMPPSRCFANPKPQLPLGGDANGQPLPFA